MISHSSGKSGASGARIELRTFGASELRAADGRSLDLVLAQPKRLALLVYLAIAAPGGFVRRDTLLAMFWPESDDEHARGALRQAVRYLRRALGGGVLVNRADEEMGIADGALRCDAAEFRRLSSAGDAAGALELYQGDLLDGFFVADVPEFERWLEQERSSLRAAAADAAWSLADLAEQSGAGATACDWARRAVHLAPLDESGVRRWMSLMDRAGDRTGAVRAYEELARRLHVDMELEPQLETRTLVSAIRSRELGVPVAPAARLDRENGTVEVASPEESPAVLRRISGTRRYIAVVGAVIALLTIGIVSGLLPPAAGAPLNPRRVVVAPFENRTGDATLDPVGSMTADWIIEGMAGRGALEVVPMRAVLVSLRALADPSATPGGHLRLLAEETGSGTSITGSFYRQGDSLHFHAHITDAVTGSLLAAIGPVGTVVDRPLDAIHRLRQAVLAALAPLSEEREVHIRLVGRPPSYEAYRAYILGFEAFLAADMATALRHFERAADDSSYLMPAVAAGIMHTNLGNYAAADSIARRVNRSRDALGPLELATLDMLQGWLSGDDVRAYEASVRQARIAPGSVGEYQVAEQARRLNRPRETVRVLTAMGAERGELRGFRAYWRELTTAHHMLGNHREEMKAARRARELYPRVAVITAWEVQALAALGRVTDVNAWIDAWLASPGSDVPTPGALMLLAGRELRAHGHEAGAAQLLARSLEWYEAQESAGRVRSTPNQTSIGLLLYELERWQDAWEVLAPLADELPESVFHRGLLGVTEARRGNRAEAERHAAWLNDLSRPFLFGEHTLWQARIAAVLGDHEAAVELLARSFTQGEQHGLFSHSNLDLLLLRDYKPFRALVRPRR